MDIVRLALAGVVSYLLGSIPTAFIFGRMKGLDIRQHGSGNVGATNAFRVLGKEIGIVVLLLDILKGALVPTLVAALFGIENIISIVILCLIVVAGHNWTIFLQFKGGKGIATSLGVLIGLTIKMASVRMALFVTVSSWVIVFLTTGIVSLASIFAAILLPITMVFTHQPIEVVSLGIIFCLLVVFRHQPNIKRLFAGQEPKVTLPFHRKRYP